MERKRNQLRGNFNKQHFRRIKSVSNWRIVWKNRKEEPDARKKHLGAEIHCIWQLIELAR